MAFAAKLKKILHIGKKRPIENLLELTRAQTELLGNLGKRGDDLSLQIEEIYDIVKGADENTKELGAAVKRETLLLHSLVAVSDLLEGLLPCIPQHEKTILAKKEEYLHACGLEQLGFVGERLDPRMHTVASAEHSDAPVESVVRVLESGYAYRGKIVRKATVVLSKGVDDA